MATPRVRVNEPKAFSGNSEALHELSEFGFPAFRRVRESDRLSNVIPASWRGGIYVFTCENGDVYVGQTAVQLSTRLGQHRRNVPGICAVTFLRTRRSLLDQCERDVHHALQRTGVRLSNITFASLETGPSTRFSEMMSEQEQQEWLDNPTFIVDGESRPASEQRTSRMQRDYEKFCDHPASAWMVRAMGRYVWRTIPVPRATERTYWGVTLRIEPDGAPWLRLNVGAQTTLDLYGDNAWGTRVRIFMPRERFEWGSGLQLPDRTVPLPADGGGHYFAALRRYSSLRALPSSMVEAGRDQYSVDGELEPMMGLLEQEGWIREARAMHLDMMQRRKGINGRSHNVFVADEFLESDPMELLGTATDGSELRIPAYDMAPDGE